MSCFRLVFSPLLVAVSFLSQPANGEPAKEPAPVQPAKGSPGFAPLFHLVIPRQPGGVQPSAGRITFARDGKTLVSADTSQAVTLWDLQTRKPRWRLPRPNFDQLVSYIYFAPEGDRLITVLVYPKTTTKALVRDIREGKLVETIDSKEAGIRDFRVFPDGKEMLGYNRDELILWDLKKKTVTRLPLEGDNKKYSFENIAIAPDGSQFLTALQAKANTTEPFSKILVWDAKTNKPIREVPALETKWLIYSPDGKSFASEYSHDESGVNFIKGGGNVYVWDPATGKKLLTIQAFGLGVSSMAYSADGKYLLAGGYDKPAGGLVRVLDLATCKFVNEFFYDAKDFFPRYITASPDGKLLAVGGEDGIKVYSMDQVLNRKPKPKE